MYQSVNLIFVRALYLPPKIQSGGIPGAGREFCDYLVLLNLDLTAHSVVMCWMHKLSCFYAVDSCQSALTSMLYSHD